MSPLPIFLLHWLKNDPFADSDPRTEIFTDQGVITQEPSNKLKGAEGSKEKPEV